MESRVKSGRMRIVALSLAALLGLVLSACGPAKVFGFQFYLTDAAGNPINGNKNIQIALYNVASGGSAVYSETHNNVAVTDGLANLEIGSVTDLDPAIFAQPLWMEITVDGETLSPRQKLVGAPYAMTLVGGSVVGSAHAGDGSDGTDANYGTLSVIASGNQGTAMVLGTSGNGDFLRACDNIVSADRSCPQLTFQIQNDGSVFTTADTQIAVTPLKMVQTTATANYSILLSSQGYTMLRPTASGTSYVYLPVDLPNTVLGGSQKLKSIKVCYRVTTATSYIAGTYVFYANTSLGRDTLLSDTTARKGTTATCYTVPASTPLTINGPVFIRFDLSYGGTGSGHDIHIGQVTLTLTED